LAGVLVLFLLIDFLIMRSVSDIKDSVDKWQKNLICMPTYKLFRRCSDHSMHSSAKSSGIYCPQVMPRVMPISGLENGEYPALSLLHIDHPNGLEMLKGKPFFRMGGGLTTLDVKSHFTGNMRILFEARQAPVIHDLLRGTCASFRKLEYRGGRSTRAWCIGCAGADW